MKDSTVTQPVRAENVVLSADHSGRAAGPENVIHYDNAQHSPRPNISSASKFTSVDAFVQIEESQIARRREKLASDLEVLSGKKLILTYPSEHNSWRNAKNRSKRLRSISGLAWGPELSSFPGFLRVLGPRPEPSDSLDRIDPTHGYVIGNVRWASKKLQSENRQVVMAELVDGQPITYQECATITGLSADAVRMRHRRGQTLKSIIEKARDSSLQASIEDWPWPDCCGGANQWEAWYQRERENLNGEDQSSRTAYLVAKTEAMRSHYLALSKQLWEESDQDPDHETPVALQRKIRFWSELRDFAWQQRMRAKPAKPELAPPPPLEPSEEELELLSAFGLAP